MRIKNLHIQNFRNYSELKLSLDYDIIFITGNNGTGKTSILEAISLLNQLKSFRKVQNQEIIRWGEAYFQIQLEYEANEKPEVLHMGYGHNEEKVSSAHLTKSPLTRVLKVNKKKIERVREFLGRLQTVIFTPDDIKIIDTDPSARRKYIDMVMSIVHPGYLIDLQEYNKALKMRASILKNGIKDDFYFRSVDRILAQKGSAIVQARKEFIQSYSIQLNRYVSLISDNHDAWKMRYFPSMDFENPEEYFQTIKHYRSQDIRLKVTTRGIHRDRILFYPSKIDIKKDVKTIASQGQKRTLALSLKMAQYSYIQNIIHDSPVLLIDDVFNELDVTRRKKIISFLKETGQAIITTTDTSGLEEFLSEKKESITIQEYSIELENNIPKIYKLKK